MSSRPRSAREEERRLNIGTLIIASLASAVAAIVTSQFWIAGTPVAAAITPVIVTVVSELLHRPAGRIADRFTVETDALPAEAAGGGPPPRRPDRGPEPAREDPAQAEPRVSVYRAPSRRRKLPVRTIAVTAALAFVIGAAILTLPEILTGQSIGKGDGKTSIFATDRDRDTQTEQTPQEQAPQQVPEEQPQTTPTETTPQEQPTQTTPAPPTTAPQTTTPVPIP